MSDDTRLDRALKWFKNNTFFSALLLLAVVIIGASQLVGALSSLLNTSEDLRSKAPIAETDHPDIALVGEYGAKGSGPGYFNDARYLAIDRNREVIIGEYGNRSRVQRFQLTGAPIAEWYLGTDPMNDYFAMGMVTDPEGAVYLVHQDLVLKRDVASGRPLGEAKLPSSASWGTSLGMQTTGAIVIGPSDGDDNDLAMVHYGSPDRIVPVKLPMKHDSITLSSHLAVDGDDDLYLLDMSGAYVYKLSPSGEFMNRFAGEGMGKGLMHLASAITVDGKGDVYVADMNGIEVFTGDGRFVATLHLPKIDTFYPVRDMAFDRNHDLWAIYDDRLRRFRLPVVKDD